MRKPTLDKNLRFIWSDLMNDRSRGLAKRSLTMVILGSLLLIAAPYGISIFVNGMSSRQLDPLLLGGIVFIALQLLEIGVGLVRQRLRERFFQEEFWFLPQAISKLSFSRPLAWLSGATSDIDGGGIESLRDKVWHVIGTYIYTIIPIYSQTLFGLVACFYANPLIGIAALFYVITELKLGQMNNRFIQTNMRPVIDEFKRWERRMSEWWHSIDHIKYHGVETKILQQIHAEVQSPLKTDDLVWRKYYANWIAIRRGVSLVYAAIIYALTGYLVYKTGTVSGAAGVLVFFSLQRVRNTLGELSDQQRDVQFNLASIAKYRRALVQPVPFSYEKGVDFVGHEIAIRYDGVSHEVGKKDGAPKLVLRDVQLDIAPGEKIGIVGPSGAGKSQLLSLLVRSTDPVAGSILINGADLRTLRPESLLRYYGVIMQKSEPFEDTVLGNLLLGVSHLDLSTEPQGSSLATIEERAHDALHKAGLDASLFSGGLYANIGYKGLKLSGGQQQRLQIAAAHLKLSMSLDRPRLIIADEPTASLDSLSELTVMEHLQDNLPAGTTMLMVAHRLSTVSNMDRIVFVRPLEQCADCPQVTTHDSLAELYVSEPLFRQMADAQGFRP